MPSKRSQFRNDVIHNGIIPSQAQARNFGEWVISNVYDILEVLKPKHENSMTKHVFYYGKKRAGFVDAKLDANPDLRDLPEGGCALSSLLGTNFGPAIFKRNSFGDLLAKRNEPLWTGINPNVHPYGGTFKGGTSTI
jgi:hypothetical protein